jgi:hypothetical protein
MWGEYAKRGWKNKAGVNDPPTGSWWDFAKKRVGGGSYAGVNDPPTGKLVGFGGIRHLEAVSM